MGCKCTFVATGEKVASAKWEPKPKRNRTGAFVGFANADFAIYLIIPEGREMAFE